MHPNRKFHIADKAEMTALVREIGFGTLVAETAEGLRAVHVPVLLESDELRFHISRGNALHAALAAGCEALFVCNGPDAYVSPDWYGLPDRVPTWNYVAVELNGPVQRMDEAELVAFLEAISDAREARLAPKPAWTRAKMSLGRFDALLKAIDGFTLHIRDWRGTAKLDQDKPDEVRAHLADAHRGLGETAMAALTAKAKT